MRIDFTRPGLPGSGTLVIGIGENGRLSLAGRELDNAAGDVVSRALQLAGGKLERGATIDVLCPHGLDLDRLVLFGLDAADDLSVHDFEVLGGKLALALKGLGVAEARIAVEVIEGSGVAPASQAVALATGARLRSYRFDTYRDVAEDEDTLLAGLTFELDDHVVAAREDVSAAAVAAGVAHARDLVSEPANILDPAAFAEACRGLGDLGLKVDILERDALEELGMGALLGVAQGSIREPFVATMRWDGGDGDEPPVALVGKGVCFDSGGLSLKTAKGMEGMKWDMGGAGAVFGAMKALAGRKARANVVGVLGLVENMPSATAQRPGDIVRAMSGTTIEVLNTDAEGRLVLADVLWFTQERFKPKAMIDLATLTGAVIVALGHEMAGLFANDDELAAALRDAGSEVGELLWRLPMSKAYAKHIKSDIADIKNMGRERQAGSTAGAMFLERFVKEGVPWAHLDIAGTAWSSRNGDLWGKGATGFGVRLLDRLIVRHFES